MKQTFGNLALGKKIDLGLQVLAFAGVLLLYQTRGTGLLVFYFAGAVQTFSALLWTLYFHKGPPAYTSAVAIRYTFLSVAPFLALTCLAGEGGIFLINCIMLIAGPLLGVSYFIITILEIRYYSKARKPYYLL